MVIIEKQENRVLLGAPRIIVGAPRIIAGATSTLREKEKIPPCIFKNVFVHPTHSA